MAADLINEGPIQLKEQLMDELWHLEFHIWKRALENLHRLHA